MTTATRKPAAKKPASKDLRRANDKASKAEIEADRLEQIIRLRSARTPWRDVENLDRHREEMAETIDLLLRLAVRDAVAAQSIVERAQATAQASRLLRQWADLYGLNAPKRLEAKIDVTHTTPIDEELARLAEQLGLDAPVGD
jgi:hypothetical protein